MTAIRLVLSGKRDQLERIPDFVLSEWVAAPWKDVSRACVNVGFSRS